MQFNAQVQFNIREYTEDGYEYTVKEKFISVEAESQDLAEEKIYNYFNEKSDGYYISYDVSDIEFFTRID